MELKNDKVDFSMRNFGVDIDSRRRLKLLNLGSAKLEQRFEVAKQKVRYIPEIHE
jgi:hypothetical protein